MLDSVKLAAAGRRQAIVAELDCARYRNGELERGSGRGHGYDRADQGEAAAGPCLDEALASSQSTRAVSRGSTRMKRRAKSDDIRGRARG